MLDPVASPEAGAQDQDQGQQQGQNQDPTAAPEDEENAQTFRRGRPRPTQTQNPGNSPYFRPVLRDRKADANSNDPDGNVGQVLTARSVQLQFRGNANGPANARAAWSCTGFQNRIATDKSPLCPRGSQVLRILDFPSCWDGQNTDSANHRTHVVFPGQNGACPQGTRAIPQLRMTLAYSVPQGPSFALDSFPEEKHNPITDHADFANVMPDRLMRFVVDCINRGRRC
ncbi:DUF1996 domain-containing protein [Nonomuraea sp. SYSU D8015]|uniref:DUF1996 domain-containing protein n=1 Tax=Nonomuraea sp. SYSU D8015 TaxID=2593644 RepID=UPI0016603EDB|nr:DUF1996 domain-containing protein [Nonomuraea sp. SYSU D8015]